MTIEEAVEILRAHNEWRRYDGITLDGPEMQDPKLIGIAIDLVCAALSWQGIRRIVQVADDLLKVEYSTDDKGEPIALHKLPDFCDTEEHYYTEILKRFRDED